MGYAKMETPDGISTFLFEWMPDVDEVLLTRLHERGRETTNLTKEKARITWDNFIRAGFKICQASH